jgi:hypothetical protein
MHAIKTDSDFSAIGFSAFAQIPSGFFVWRLSPTHLEALGEADAVDVSMHGELESIDDGEDRQCRRTTKHGKCTLLGWRERNP